MSVMRFENSKNRFFRVFKTLYTAAIFVALMHRARLHFLNLLKNEAMKNFSVISNGFKWQIGEFFLKGAA